MKKGVHQRHRSGTVSIVMGCDRSYEYTTLTNVVTDYFDPYLFYDLVVAELQLFF
jgi:hypothetical protein